MRPASGCWEWSPVPPARQAIQIVLDVLRRHRFNDFPLAHQVAKKAARRVRIVFPNRFAVTLVLKMLLQTCKPMIYDRV